MADEHERIYKQNEDQYSKIYENTRRIAKLEADMGQLKADLIGVTGRNGLRGEFRAHKKENDEQMKEVLQSLDGLQKRISSWVKWTVGTIIATAGVIVALAEMI